MKYHLITLVAMMATAIALPAPEIALRCTADNVGALCAETILVVCIDHILLE